MKHLSITIATLAIVAFVSCEKIGGDNDKNNPYKPLELTTKSAEFVQKGNDFSVEFIDRIDAVAKSDYIISPLSMQFLLGMVLDGAQQQTADEICTVLGYGQGEKEAVDQYCLSMLEQLPNMDKKTKLTIANALFADKDMPVLDGAEACYPLYAAYAKACYKDIDEIERQWVKAGNDQYLNGKIVSFTNTIRGFDRLVFQGDDTEKNDYAVDMLFGARPSADQLAEAEYMGVELDITPIGKEGFVFFVEEDNPVDGLSSDQLRAIYHGEITNWKEVGGKDQEIRAF